VDYDDWMINPMVFQWLDSLWGPHIFHKFAAPGNAQLDRFNSRFWVPGSEAVDVLRVTGQKTTIGGTHQSI